uniref:Uncharacterized protein n=1 Tax=Arundo donax TaxID=35708 RepID=A0A0A9E664_ARUDO
MLECAQSVVKKALALVMFGNSCVIINLCPDHNNKHISTSCIGMFHEQIGFTYAKRNETSSLMCSENSSRYS